MPLDHYITFIAADDLYEDGGLLSGSSQDDALPLGPFADPIRISHQTIRVGANVDEPLAVYVDGLWRVGAARVPDGNTWRTVGPSDKSLLFSDISIHARERDADPAAAADSEYIRIVAEYSTRHITKSSNDRLFEHAIVPEDQYRLPAHRELPTTVLRTGYGFFISVPADTTDGREVLGQLPSDVAVLLTLARKHDADWLLLDADGPVHENLPKYDW